MGEGIAGFILFWLLLWPTLIAVLLAGLFVVGSIVVVAQKLGGLLKRIAKRQRSIA